MQGYVLNSGCERVSFDGRMPRPHFPEPLRRAHRTPRDSRAEREPEASLVKMGGSALPGW